MLIYILLLGYVVFAGLAIDVTNRVQKRNYCVSVCLLLILLIGLRSEELGLYDTAHAYVPHFKNMCKLTFSDIMTNVIYEDKGFYLFAKIFSLICNNSQAWLFVIGIPLPVAISLLIYKESTCPYISYLFYFALGYFGYSFFLLRQVLAISFCIFAYLCFQTPKKERIIVGIAFLALAFTFHATSIVFILILLLSRFFLNREFLDQYSNIISVVIAAIGLVFGRIILSYAFRIISWSRILEYENNRLSINNSLLLMYLAIYMVLLIIRLITKNKDELNNYQLIIFSIAVFFMSLVQDIGNIYRMAIYFGIYSIVLCPNILCGKNFTSKSKVLIRTILVIFLCYIFLSRQIWGTNLAPYIFFWE